MPLGEIATARSGSVGVMASACLEEEIDRNTGGGGGGGEALRGGGVTAMAQEWRIPAEAR